MFMVKVGKYTVRPMDPMVSLQVLEAYTKHTVDGWNPAPPGMYETL